MGQTLREERNRLNRALGGQSHGGGGGPGPGGGGGGGWENGPGQGPYGFGGGGGGGGGDDTDTLSAILPGRRPGGPIMVDGRAPGCSRWNHTTGYPRPQDFEQCKYALRVDLASHSAHPPHAMGWLNEIDSSHLVDLYRPGPLHENLDSIIRTAIVQKRPTRELGDEVMRMESLAAGEDMILSGRQYLNVIFSHYSMRRTGGEMYTWNDIQRVHLGSDRNGQKFLNSFCKVVRSMANKHRTEGVLDLLIKELRHSSLMASDMGHYDRQEQAGMPAEEAYFWLIKQDLCRP